MRRGRQGCKVQLFRIVVLVFCGIFLRGGLHRGKLSQTHRAEAAQKGDRCTVGEGPAGQFQTAGLLHKTLVSQGRKHAGGNHAAYLFDKGTGYRLVVGDDRRHLQRGGGEWGVAAKLLRGADQLRLTGAAAKLVAVF